MNMKNQWITMNMNDELWTCQRMSNVTAMWRNVWLEKILHNCKFQQYRLAQQSHFTNFNLAKKDRLKNSAKQIVPNSAKLLIEFSILRKGSYGTTTIKAWNVSQARPVTCFNVLHVPSLIKNNLCLSFFLIESKDQFMRTKNAIICRFPVPRFPSSQNKNVGNIGWRYRNT